jgi:hypothetical protein
MDMDYMRFRAANGLIDDRDGAYDSGNRGYYETNGARTSQATVDRHNAGVFARSNGAYRDIYVGSYSDGYYATNGTRVSQSAIDRHNDEVFRRNNGDYPDRLHGNSATRSKPKKKHWWQKIW